MNIQTVIDQVDLVEYAERLTELNKQGDVYRGVCPICGHDNNTEFVVYNHKTFHCWACGKSGDVINLIRARDHVDFYTAVETLAEELNIDVNLDPKYAKRKELVNNHKKLAIIRHKNVDVVRDYLNKERNISDETINDFMLGADDYGNVNIPLIDINGRYVGEAIRRFEGQPKYLTNKNDDVFVKSEFLYNLRGAKEQLTNTLYMVEGFFCAMSLHQVGLSAVAYNSSQPTKQHLLKLQKIHVMYPEMTVVLVPDNDGIAYPLVSKVRKNAMKYAPDVPFEVLILPAKVKDVNDFFSDGGNRTEFEKLQHIPIDIFVLATELDKCSSESAERKVVEQFSKTVRDNLMLINIADMLTERWKMSRKAILDFLDVSSSDTRLDEDFKGPEQCLMETKNMLTEASMQYGLTAVDGGVRGGGRRKDVTFIGGYSSSGKTFLTICMAMDMVVRQRKHVLYFSMEMSAGALYERVIACLLQRPVDIVDDMIKSGSPLVYNVLEKLKQYIYVVDKNGLDIEQVDKYIKKSNAKLFDGNLDVVFIDYIQYMKNCAQYDVLAETAKGMKPLAKENNIHVVVLSQLNRGARIWEKPSMADLKGGGDLEASADNIFLLWRPGKNPDLLPDEARLKKDKVMLGIGKARNGSKIEEVELVMDSNTSRIRMAD